MSGDGDTTVRFVLNTGSIAAGEDVIITYQAQVDGIFEGAGDQNYENTEELLNSATFYGTVEESGNNAERGFTDPSLLGQVVIDVE